MGLDSKGLKCWAGEFGLSSADSKELWRILGSHFRKIDLESVLLMRTAVREKEGGYDRHHIYCLSALALGSLGKDPFACPPHYAVTAVT